MDSPVAWASAPVVATAPAAVGQTPPAGMSSRRRVPARSSAVPPARRVGQGDVEADVEVVGARLDVSPMAPYTDAHLEEIAASIGMPVEAVRRQSNVLDRAVFWYRSFRGVDSNGNRLPTREPPHKRRKKMEKVARAARRLLASLRIEFMAAAVDGPGDSDILELLSYYPKGSDEDLVRSSWYLWRNSSAWRLRQPRR